MEEFYKAIEDKIKASGYPGEVNGEDIYNDICDQMEETLREKLAAQALYLTDRFSPGYGDMPLAQSGQICEVLNAGRSIGLTVSQSGILMPRKSVTAVLGISRTQVLRRPKGCEGCSARQTCAFARREDITEE